MTIGAGEQSENFGQATIYDIARHVGVSHTTVGRALKNAGRVSKDTRAKVLKVAQEIGYRPSMVGQMLASRRTMTLGILVPVMGDTSHYAIVKAVEQAAFLKGYSVILCNTDMSPEKRHEAIDMLIRRRVEGVIVIPLDCTIFQDGTDIAKLQAAGISVVMISGSVAGDLCDTVCPDLNLAIKCVVEHLIKLGHKRIGYFCGMNSEWDFSERDRIAGFKAGLETGGIEFDPSLCLECAPFTKDEASSFDRKAVERYMQRPDRPTAIVCYCDMLAIKVIRTMHQMKIHVPEDVAIVGIDNILAGAYVYPSLTTYAQPTEQTGQQAFEILLSRIEEKPEKKRPAMHMRLDGKLIVRESCGILGTDSIE